MTLYWLCYRHNNQISVVIEPGASLVHARLRASLDGLDEGDFTEGHELDRKSDSTQYDKDKATPTPPIIAMLPLEEEQDTNTNQEQTNGVECCYFVAGDKPDQLLHDGSSINSLTGNSIERHR